MKRHKVLIADDDRSITEGLSAILRDEGYEVSVAIDGQKALDQLGAEAFGVVLADLKMPKVDGLALLKELQLRAIPTECIIVTGQATVDSAVQAMREGAYDYVEKPLTADKLNRLKALIPKALEKFNVQQKNRELSSQLEGLTHFGELTGQSEEMRAVYQIIEAVAPSSASALPKDILENELFGHEKGAFTGSTNEKPGAFEMADGGTIFLDEVAEMPPDIQVKLLRAIESRTIRRLGGKKEIEVDIRILAATNRDVQKALTDNDLREDLYYRLAVVELFLPPLRERIGDIKLLANEFLGRFAEQNGKPMTGFDEAAWEWILSHNWPGNVRELKNAVERAVIMTRGDTIKAADIMPRHLRRGQDPNASITVPPGATLADTRRQLVLRAFASTNGDYARTATIVGMSASDVRAEIASLLNGKADGEGVAAASGTMNGVQRSGRPADAQAPAPKAGKAPAKSAAGAKSKAKKR